jgi:hypothetical protein
MISVDAERSGPLSERLIPPGYPGGGGLGRVYRTVKAFFKRKVERHAKNQAEDSRAALEVRPARTTEKPSGGPGLQAAICKTRKGEKHLTLSVVRKAEVIYRKRH